jgi:hydrophobic/amphiphilic exporter-1 (mainly G- bacteria), HAE1 family
MSLISGAINRPVTVSMAMVATILFGAVSLDRLAVNLLPDISYPSLTIQCDYEDAAPEEVESLITRPIEESVGVIPGLTRLSSVSRSGQAEVVLEFGWHTNMDLVAMETREKLDLVNLPRDSRRPVILRFDPSNDPIMRLQLSGTNMSLARLRYAAEKELKKNLESTDGVAAIKVIGGLEEQIRIEIDEKRLAELGIPIGEVTQVLAQENLNQASGSLYDLDANYLVRILNQFKSVEEIQQIIIRNQGGRKIVLGDVAKVWRGSKDREIITRLNGKESVEMAIYKEGDANTVTVAQAVKARLDSLKKANLMPKGVAWEVVFNQADFIKSAVDDLFDSAVIGGILAILVLYLFLRDLRSTLIIGVTIPISILGTFGVMYQTGITLNLMSLGGVALGVGMLVDNSIVILESVHRHKLMGGKLKEAVSRGTHEVAMAVTASTFTSVAVFLPLIFVEGIAGQLFKDQALTITYSQIVSLLIGITLTPMILAWRMRRPVAEADAVRAASKLANKPGVRHMRAAGRFLSNDVLAIVLTDLRRLLRALARGILLILGPVLDRFENTYNRCAGMYPPLLRWALDHKGSVLAFACVLVAVSGALVMLIGGELIPPVTQGEFSFEIKLPEGKALQETDRIMRQLEAAVLKYPEVKTIFSSVGGSNKNQFARDRHEENYGQLYVVMKDKRSKEAERTIADRIRSELQHYPEIASVTFSRPTLFSIKTPVEVEVFGYDLASLRAAGDKIAKRMDRIAGLSDLKTSTELGNPEIQVRFDRERLARLGLEESQIANTLRSKIRGDVASRYREEDKQIEILVRADESDRNTVEDIRNLAINLAPPQQPGTQQRTSQRDALGQPAEGQPSQQPPPATAAAPRRAVPILLGSIADVRIDRGPAEVRRIRSQRAAVVSANLSGRDLNSVSEEIRAVLQQLRAEMPPEVTVGLGGQNEEMQRSYKTLMFALALAVFLVYLVMASEFESLVHPFIILFSVPLGLIGVVLSLFVTGTTFSIMVFLGIIILAGIVVNNAIVLIDYANQLRHEGYNKREALCKAGEVRLRPILMTTLTSVLGLLPMAFGWGEGAEIRTPMAITVIGGLMFSTLLTLVFIPVLYEMLDRKRYVTDEVLQPASVSESAPNAAPLPSAGD